MKDLLKLQVLFTTLIDSSKSLVHCKIPNVDLIEDLIKNGLQNSTQDYAIAYIDSFPTFDQYNVTYVEWVRLHDIEKKKRNGDDKWNLNVEVIEEFEPDSFAVEFGLDNKMDLEVPKFIVLSDVNLN
jgi:hypothetical protein